MNFKKRIHYVHILSSQLVPMGEQSRSYPLHPFQYCYEYFLFFQFLCQFSFSFSSRIVNVAVIQFPQCSLPVLCYKSCIIVCHLRSVSKPSDVSSSLSTICIRFLIFLKCKITYESVVIHIKIIRIVLTKLSIQYS